MATVAAVTTVLEFNSRYVYKILHVPEERQKTAALEIEV